MVTFSRTAALLTNTGDTRGAKRGGATLSAEEAFLLTWLPLLGCLRKPIFAFAITFLMSEATQQKKNERTSRWVSQESHESAAAAAVQRRVSPRNFTVDPVLRP